MTLPFSLHFSPCNACEVALGRPFQRITYPQALHRPRMPQRHILLSNALSEKGRASSAPPDTMRGSFSSTIQPGSIPPPGPRKFWPSSSDTNFPREPRATSLDLIDYLERSEQSLVKTRSGSVLSRGCILKTDHYPSGMSSSMRSLV